MAQTHQDPLLRAATRSGARVSPCPCAHLDAIWRRRTIKQAPLRQALRRTPRNAVGDRSRCLRCGAIPETAVNDSQTPPYVQRFSASRAAMYPGNVLHSAFYTAQ
ncbi:hypothetical protein DPSP01_011444 [Paraphaeosphaeria sporulosa]